MPRNNCAICADARRDAIDATLIAGERLKDVAEQFAISKFSLSRHRARHLPLASLPETSIGGSLQEQIDFWREAAIALLNQSTADADTRGQAQAVAAGLRSVELQAKQQERDAEVRTRSGDDDPIPVQQLDQFVQPIVQALAELQKCADQRTLEIAYALIHSDPYMLRKAKLIAQGENCHEFVS